ncbi:hypothetical protein QAD02_019993 [Eretmocerus hayati]|uniref:Uncharacterized protein n=1 Tax=Eretmocerus hayati TaxID=131215 RepID=A0ACC2PL49_9HYME|nr:hypothetical protein QAD02_019993 [Eretmocerus hayati]
MKNEPILLANQNELSDGCKTLLLGEGPLRRGSEKSQSSANRSLAGNPDILICGNCREMFTDLSELLEHKRDYCKLRFTCKCHTLNNGGPAPGNSATSLMCINCKDSFPSAWELMVHAQAIHMLNIYELGSKPDTKFSRSVGQSNNNNNNNNNKESSQSPTPQDQENKGSEGEERGDEEMELDGHVLLPSPDSGKSTDNENALSPIKIRSEVNGSDHDDCEELIVVEKRNSTTSQPCFTRGRAIAIVSFDNPPWITPCYP